MMMIRFLIAAAFLAFGTIGTTAQNLSVVAPGCTISGNTITCGATSLTVFSTSLANGSIFVGNSSNIATAVTPSGDLTMTNAGAFTVTKTGGVSFGYFATGTDAGNLSGTVVSARISGAYSGITGVGTLASGAIPTSLLTGTLAAAQFPALTGDITTSAGSLATSLASSISGAKTFSTSIAIGAGSAITSSGAGGALTTLAYTTPGTGIAAALAINVGSAGAPVLFNGAGGTPSSMTATNLTGTASGLTAGSVTGLSVTSGKTLTVSNTMTFTATDGSTIAFGAGGTVLYGNQSITLSGDVSGFGTTAITTTLATVNSNVGTFGSATQASQVTVNAKGLVTAAANVTVTPAVGSITGLGTGVATALAINVGSAGAFVTFNGALGTPSSGTATNLTGLPISTGLTGAGTGVLTALGVNVGSAGAFVVNGGALGTPSSGTLTSATGLPISTGVSGLGTGIATALAVNTGSAGAPVLFNSAGGTPSSMVGTNITGTASGLTSGAATVLATARAIYGNNFDGSAALTQIIASTYGGTGNGFTKFTGPATSEKTFTLPNASATVLTDNAAVTVAQGGTGLATLTANNVILGNGTSTPGFVAPGSSGNVLTSNGTTWTSAAPAGGTLTANSTATSGYSAGQLIYSDGALIQASTGWTYGSSVLTNVQALAANTSGDGLVLSNMTAATAGNQRYSPRLRLTGQGWKTTATAASQAVDWILENQPVQGTANPTSTLTFSAQVNAGGYTSVLGLTSAGQFNLTTASATHNTVGLYKSATSSNYINMQDGLISASNYSYLAIGIDTDGSDLGQGAGAIISTGVGGSGTSRNLILAVDTTSTGDIIFNISRTNKWKIKTTSGNFVPATSAALDIGSSSLLVRNTYTQNVFVHDNSGVYYLGASDDTILTRAAAATWQFGAADVASGAVAQTIIPQSNTGATTTGPLFLVKGAGGGTGAGSVGGEVRIQGGLTAAAGTGGAVTIYTAPSGAGGTPAVVATFASTKAVTLTGAVLLTGIGSDSGQTDSTVCIDSTSKTLYAGSGTLGICLGTSSARYKDNIVPMLDGMTQIAGLKPVNFHYRKGHGDDGARRQYGFLAEDVVRELPGLVGLDTQGRPNSVDMLGMVPVLVGALQSVDMRVLILEARVNRLQADNDNLRAMRRAANE